MVLDFEILANDAARRLKMIPNFLTRLLSEGRRLLSEGSQLLSEGRVQGRKLMGRWLLWMRRWGGSIVANAPRRGGAGRGWARMFIWGFQPAAPEPEASTNSNPKSAGSLFENGAEQEMSTKGDQGYGTADDILPKEIWDIINLVEAE